MKTLLVLLVLAASALAQTDPDAAAYFSAITTAGGTISAGQQTAINTFVVAAKAHTYWSNLTDVGPFAGDQLAAALVKLKTHPSASSGTLGNSNFVSGDYGATTGLQGNSSTSHFLDTTLPESAISGGTYGMSFWLRGVGGSLPSSSAGLRCMGVSPDVDPYVYAGVEIMKVSNNSVVQTVQSDAFSYGPGLYHAIKASTTAVGLYANGVKEKAFTGSATGTLTSRTTNISVFGARNNTGTAVFDACTANLAWYAIDDGTMTAQQIQDYAADVQALEIALGRAAPASWTLQYVPMIGQSLSVGSLGTPALTTSPINSAKMWPKGPVVSAANDTTLLSAAPEAIGSMAPLREWTTETMLSAFAAQVGAMWRAGHPSDASQDPMVSTWGISGDPYASLKQGTPPYSNSITGLQGAFTMAPALYAGLTVPAVLAVHGEADANNAAYGTDIVAWQANYQADIQAVTGQVTAIPMFHSQPDYETGAASPSLSPELQLEAYEADPTHTVLVGPKYFLVHSSGAGSASAHLINSTYRVAGEYYAMAYYKQIIQGQQWSPLRPVRASVKRYTGSATIAWTMTGIVGNLVLDTSTVTDPTGGCYGFRYVDTVTTHNITTTSGSTAATLNSGTSVVVGQWILATNVNYGTTVAAISGTSVTLSAVAPVSGIASATFSSAGCTSVSIVNAATGTMQMTLNVAPTGASPQIAYADLSQPSCGTSQCNGTSLPISSGARGNLRDSNTVVGALSGATLYNWGVKFQSAVAVATPPNLFPLPNTLPPR